MSENKKTRIKVCVPDYRPLHPLTKLSIQDLLALEQFEFKFETYNSAMICQARTVLVKDADQFDFILFIDSDMAFTNNDFMCLMSANKQVIGAGYLHGYDNKLVGGKDGKDFNIPLDTKGIVKVDWVGFGLILIKSDLLKDYCFHTSVNEAGFPSSEDYNFCIDQQCNIFMYCGLDVKHLPKEKGVYLADKDWAEVMKALLNHPMPYLQATKIITSVKHYLEKSG